MAKSPYKMKNKGEAYNAGFAAGLEEGREQGRIKARFETEFAVKDAVQSNADMFAERAQRVEQAAQHRIENGARDAAEARKDIENQRNRLRAANILVQLQLEAAVATIKALL